MLKVHCWPGQLKANCLCWSLLTGMEKGKKSNCQINSCIPGTRDGVNLLKQRNHIWYCSFNWSRHLDKLMLIHCNSPKSICLLHKPNMRVGWSRAGNYSTYVFPVLAGGTDKSLESLKECSTSFWLILFPSGGGFSGFHMVCPIITPLPPQVREPMWGFCQVLSMLSPIMHSRTEETSTGWLWDLPTGLPERYIWAKT